jgi:hypothetical protein
MKKSSPKKTRKRAVIKVATVRSALDKDMTERVLKAQPYYEIIHTANVYWMPRDTKGRNYYQHFLMKLKGVALPPKRTLVPSSFVRKV